MAACPPPYQQCSVAGPCWVPAATETRWSTADTSRHVWNGVSEATRHSRRPQTATAEFWPKADEVCAGPDREVRLASRYLQSRRSTPEEHLRQTPGRADRGRRPLRPGYGNPFDPDGVAAAGSCRWTSRPVRTSTFASVIWVAAPGAREAPEDLLALPCLVAALTALEREVIMLRFFQDLDQDAIAARVGFSEMHVSRLHAGPGPHARSAGGTLTEPSSWQCTYVDGGGHLGADPRRDPGARRDNPGNRLARRQ